MNDRMAPAAPAVIGRLALAATPVNTMLPVIKGNFITPDGKGLVDNHLLCLHGCNRLLSRAAPLGAYHEFSRRNRHKLGACVAVPENHPFLLLRFGKARLFNHRRGIFQGCEIGNGHGRHCHLLCHRCRLGGCNLLVSWRLRLWFWFWFSSSLHLCLGRRFWFDIGGCGLHLLLEFRLRFNGGRCDLLIRLLHEFGRCGRKRRFSFDG